MPRVRRSSGEHAEAAAPASDTLSAASVTAMIEALQHSQIQAFERIMDKLYIIIILNKDSLVLAQDKEQTFRLTDTLTRCSRRLSALIDNLCDNVYNIVKRDTSAIIDKLVPDDLLEHMKRERLRRWRRVRRQVATECCESPCTISNILLYCPRDAKVLTENPDIFS